MRGGAGAVVACWAVKATHKVRKVGRAGTYSASGAVSATRGGLEGTDGGRAHASPLGLACVQVCKSAEMTAWCGRRCPTLRLVREQVTGPAMTPAADEYGTLDRASTADLA